VSRGDAVVELRAGVPTADVDRSVAWYERVLGRPPDARPNAGEAVWELSEEARISVLHDPERVGTSRLTLVVEDLDATLAALKQRGVVPGPVQKVRRRFRRTALTDPDGNVLTFAESG
jgi:catechol 2,3-dioxygenase-like lactoylglutathione lyase family enzyme